MSSEDISDKCRSQAIAYGLLDLLVPQLVLSTTNMRDRVRNLEMYVARRSMGSWVRVIVCLEGFDRDSRENETASIIIGVFVMLSKRVMARAAPSNPFPGRRFSLPASIGRNRPWHIKMDTSQMHFIVSKLLRTGSEGPLNMQRARGSGHTSTPPALLRT